jgi:uncharacterized membrane protein
MDVVRFGLLLSALITLAATLYVTWCNPENWLRQVPYILLMAYMAGFYVVRLYVYERFGLSPILLNNLSVGTYFLTIFVVALEMWERWVNWKH